VKWEREYHKKRCLWKRLQRALAVKKRNEREGIHGGLTDGSRKKALSRPIRRKKRGKRKKRTSCLEGEGLFFEDQ